MEEESRLGGVVPALGRRVGDFFDGEKCRIKVALSSFNGKTLTMLDVRGLKVMTFGKQSGLS